jgi:biotin carboxylase
MIEGVATTIPFQLSLLDDPAFVQHRFSTTFIEQWLPSWRAAAA